MLEGELRKKVGLIELLFVTIFVNLRSLKVVTDNLALVLDISDFELGEVVQYALIVLAVALTLFLLVSLLIMLLDELLKLFISIEKTFQSFIVHFVLLDLPIFVLFALFLEEFLGTKLENLQYHLLRILLHRSV